MKFEPHAYQQYAIDRIISDPALGLFQDMGLGKTVEVLTAIKVLKFDRWEISRPLVIAPKKVAEATWTYEASKWDHLKDLRVVPILGSAAQRKKAVETPADVYVINRENTAWLVDLWRRDWPYDMVVLDESSSFKNPQAKRFRALRAVRSKIRRIVELSGTPSPNGMEDLYAQIGLLDGGERLGRTLSAFRDCFMQEDPSYPGQMYRTYSLRPGAEERIKAAIADICVSMKAEDYLDLPDFVEDIVPVQLDPAAEKAYKKLEREMFLELDTAEVTAASAAVLNGKLLQLCGGAVYAADGTPQPVHDCKLEAFAEVIEQLRGEHALVYCWYKHERDRILEVLAKTGLRVRVYQGAEDSDAWNRGEVDVLVANPASCGYGLNLQQGGRHIIWFTLPAWALEIYQQANKRLHRQGQTRPVISHILLVQGGMDCAVYNALQGKGDAQEALLQALKARIMAVQEAA